MGEQMSKANGDTYSVRQGAGTAFAERLGITVLRTEGHDSVVPCVSCESSDAGRIHQHTGVFYCFSCAKALNAFDLCKVVLGDHEAAKQVMVDVGLFEPRLSGPPVRSNGSGNRKATDAPTGPSSLLEWFAAEKGVHPNALKAFGAVDSGSTITIPMYGPDGKQCSSCWYSRNQAKGKHASGKPAGLFLPRDASGKVRLPQSGEDWIVVEGPKDAAALWEMGYRNVVGLPGSTLNKRFVEQGTSPFVGVNLVAIPDADKAGVNGARRSASRLRGVAASVKIALLPCEIEESGGQDVRDILRDRKDGADQIRQAIESARPAEEIGENGRVVEPPTPLRELIATYPRLRAPVIDNLLRAGETANIIAAPKVGKSWFTAGLMLSVASGRRWLDMFGCKAGRVLVIDGELHRETLAHRLPMVAAAMGVPEEALDSIDVLPLRGTGTDLITLGDRLGASAPGHYDLIILDALYRFIPPGVSENDNAAVMALYNTIDQYADRLQAAWVNIHHACKGDQSGKATTDIGSGAGTQSRAPDTHLTIRPHEDEGVAVVDAVVRSWPPVDPLTIRWTFPVWRLADADPRRLKRAQTARQQQQQIKDEEGIARIYAELAAHNTGTQRELRGWCGISRKRLQRLLDRMQSENRVTQKTVQKQGRPCDEYRLSPNDRSMGDE